jgi:hypothetical protein
LDPLVAILDSLLFYAPKSLFISLPIYRVFRLRLRNAYFVSLFWNCLQFVVPKVSGRVERHGSQSHEAAFESFAALHNLCLIAARLRFIRVQRSSRLLYARMKGQQEVETWLLIFRVFCKRKSWAQHASTQPPGSGFTRVDGAYNAGSVLLLVCCGGGCTQAVGPTRSNVRLSSISSFVCFVF